MNKLIRNFLSYSLVFLCTAVPVSAEVLQFVPGETIEYTVNEKINLKLDGDQESMDEEFLSYLGRGRLERNIVFDIRLEEKDESHFDAFFTVKKIEMDGVWKTSDETYKIAFDSDTEEDFEGTFIDGFTFDTKGLIGKEFSVVLPKGEDKNFVDISLDLEDPMVEITIGSILSQLFQFNGQELIEGEVINTNFAGLLDGLSDLLGMDEDGLGFKVDGDNFLEYHVKNIGEKKIHAATHSRLNINNEFMKAHVKAKGDIHWDKENALFQKRKFHFIAHFDGFGISLKLNHMVNVDSQIVE